jgi:uncharacterized RDD family membrane protein YckC
MMIDRRAIAIRRVFAFMVDWLLILAWAGTLFGIVMGATGGNPGRPINPWIAQAIGFISMTVPVVLYFAILESSRRKATLGKKALGLVVIGVAGDHTSLGKSLVRSSIKFLPWEFGHIVANQAAFSGDAGVALWVYGPMTLALVLPLWWIVSIFSTGQAPYDRVSSTHVVRDKARRPNNSFNSDAGKAGAG